MDTNENGTPQNQALAPISQRPQIGHAQPMAIVPKTFDDLQRFATALASSDLIPQKLKDRMADVMVIVAAGLELGIPPMQSIRLYHVIEGVPRLSADGIASVVMARYDVCEYLECVETTDTKCTWRTKRRGRGEQTRTWTKERAQRAKLWDRKNRDGSDGNWQKYPERMLSARAKSELCRDVYPEIAAGLTSAEEAYDGAIDAEFTEVRSNTAAFGPPSSMDVAIRAAGTEIPAADRAAAAAGRMGGDSAAPKRGPGRPSKDKPIDVPSEERPTPPPASTATSSSPATTPSATPAASPPPASTSAVPAANTNGHAPASTASDSTSQAGTSSSSGSATSEQAPPADEPPPPSDDDGFGGEDPVDTPAERSIAGFRKAISAVKPGPNAAAELQAVKADWMPWSMLEGPTGGKAHAREMRDIYGKARAELGV